MKVFLKVKKKMLKKEVEKKGWKKRLKKEVEKKEVEKKGSKMRLGNEFENKLKEKKDICGCWAANWLLISKVLQKKTKLKFEVTMKIEGSMNEAETELQKFSVS